jgi:hypothetical protein
MRRPRHSPTPEDQPTPRRARTPWAALSPNGHPRFTIQIPASNQLSSRRAPICSPLQGGRQIGRPEPSPLADDRTTPSLSDAVSTYLSIPTVPSHPRLRQSHAPTQARPLTSSRGNLSARSPVADPASPATLNPPNGEDSSCDSPRALSRSPPPATEAPPRYTSSNSPDSKAHMRRRDEFRRLLNTLDCGCLQRLFVARCP